MRRHSAGGLARDRLHKLNEHSTRQAADDLGPYRAYSSTPGHVLLRRARIYRRPQRPRRRKCSKRLQILELTRPEPLRRSTGDRDSINAFEDTIPRGQPDAVDGEDAQLYFRPLRSERSPKERTVLMGRRAVRSSERI